MGYIEITTAVTAVASTGAAAGSFWAAHRALKTAETVGRIERDRWHTELEPVLHFAIDGPRDPVMTVRFTGPTALRRLDKVELTIRNDTRHRGHGLAGGTTQEELDAVVWGPLRFRPGINDAAADGRTAGTFSLELNESRTVAMDPTLVPHWFSGGRRAWWQKWVNQPVRLWVTCHSEGHRPWTMSRDVMPDQDIIDYLITPEAFSG